MCVRVAALPPFSFCDKSILIEMKWNYDKLWLDCSRKLCPDTTTNKVDRFIFVIETVDTWTVCPSWEFKITTSIRSSALVMRVFCHRHILKLFLTNIFVDHDDKRRYSVCHWLSSHHEAQTEARSDVSENMPVLQSASSHLPVTTALWPQRVCRRYVVILQHLYCV